MIVLWEPSDPHLDDSTRLNPSRPNPKKAVRGLLLEHSSSGCHVLELGAGSTVKRFLPTASRSPCSWFHHHCMLRPGLLFFTSIRPVWHTVGFFGPWKQLDPHLERTMPLKDEYPGLAVLSNRGLCIFPDRSCITASVFASQPEACCNEYWQKRGVLLDLLNRSVVFCVTKKGK